MSTVTLRNIRKQYTDFDVIKGIDLDINDREFVVFVGPSGCGKSTLLRMIAGLEEITSGDLFIDGERMNDVPPDKRGLAMVFQTYALYPHMTVAENMAFSLRLAGLSKAKRYERARDVARILQLEPYLERKPKELSGGQRQRVAIGRALVRNPKVFLFDEPLSNLDAALRVQMRIELSSLHDSLQSTMIYVTHDQVEAMTLADKIVVLQGGIIEQVGSPLELYHRPRNLFVAGFIGSPRMNFLPVTVTAVGEVATRVELPGGEVITLPLQPGRIAVGDRATLGIRPEHLTLDHTRATMQGEVIVVERLGGETFVYAKLAGGDTIVVQTEGDRLIRTHEQIPIYVDGDRCHLFNTQGEAIPKAELHPLMHS
ncbi:MULTISPECIES: sn-glycerol-3-phosphate ABC transporter ATP-binding protein UgpC [unclassified Leptolyngbya]|uniref:ABC transporter ATP-binding protein n=1 Tax=unclassified Leptolyngbya TaxID=2650499 RepID=UPI00168A1A55|nr:MULTISPECIES: sn-glycerol-3-phosphate ABC transporter ATP-binding protein UgpC [unclassified Leptolyngbya]MBD1909461.1 sn-glycerol-3-phosphate ABC transporter ATP-binding protein UgpC [Leptolyngbya sp. FACHB-8]MBD2155642.1 sn-glycerol-3-phosphate ABC transporter ATP-binding protein UgpC [Leptolyngbya sp. FACHB-16]